MSSLLREKTVSNDAMKAAEIKDHLERVHTDKNNPNDLNYFKVLKEKVRNLSELFACLLIN